MEKKVVASLMVLVVVMSAFVGKTSAENEGHEMLHKPETKGEKGNFEQSNAYITYPALEMGSGYYKQPPAPPVNEYDRGCSQETRCRTSDKLDK